MGERLKDIYPHATRLDMLKFTARKIMTLAAISLTVFIVSGVAFLTGHYTQTAQAEAVAGDTLTAKVEQLQTDIVEQIAQLESSNVDTKDALIIPDDNKRGTLPRKDKVSIGCMQFKISTVQMYAKQLQQKDLTNYDAVLLALDCPKSKELAKAIIFQTTGGLWNWSVATKEMGLKVEFIKSLTK